MKDLLKQYVSKDYEPTFYNKEILTDYDELAINRYAGRIAVGKEKKLELYLMRDWLLDNFNKEVVINPFLGSDSSDVAIYDLTRDKCITKFTIDCGRIEALKAALEEAIKNV